MSEHELDRVIDEVLDGHATSEEAAWLKERLERDPAARDRFHQREKLFRALDPGELVAAPDDLTLQVLSAIRSGPRPLPPAPGWFSTLRASLARRPAVGLGFAFGTGAALGILIIVALTERSAGPGHPFPVMGAIGSWSPGWVVEDRARLAAGSASSSAELMRHGTSMLVRIQLESGRPSGMTLEFNPSAATVTGFGREQGAVTRINAGPGRVEFEAGGSSLTWVRFEVPEAAHPGFRLTLRNAGAASQGGLASGSRARASP
jgi:anti-sigma factor RsiW